MSMDNFCTKIRWATTVDKVRIKQFCTGIWRFVFEPQLSVEQSQWLAEQVEACFAGRKNDEDAKRGLKDFIKALADNDITFQIKPYWAKTCTIKENLKNACLALRLNRDLNRGIIRFTAYTVRIPGLPKKDKIELEQRIREMPDSADYADVISLLFQTAMLSGLPFHLYPHYILRISPFRNLSNISIIWTIAIALKKKEKETQHELSRTPL